MFSLKKKKNIYNIAFYIKKKGRKFSKESGEWEAESCGRLWQEGAKMVGPVPLWLLALPLFE